MKNKLFIAVFLLTCFISFSQEKITWEYLAKVKFVDKYFPEYEQSFLYPNFSNEIKLLEGKEVSITGYFLNLDPEGAVYILSKNPMASCFFCGVGGPETAVELNFKEKPPFKTDDIVTVTGIFKLNSDDVNHFNYIILASKAKLAE
jgi:hypothetical protein